MSDFNYRIEGSLTLVEDGEVRLEAFQRDVIMYYIGLRDGGMTHAQAGRVISEKYCRGGAPHPRVHYADEVELMSKEDWDLAREVR